VTQYGRVLVWARSDVAAKAGATPEDDPEAIARAVGISSENLRPEPRRDWVIDDEGYLLYCRRGPNNQGAPEIRIGDAPMPSHDAALIECSAQINAILADCGTKTPDSRATLALLSIPLGLFLAWTINDDETMQNPPGAITAASDVETIHRALGLARPAGGGAPPWKLVLPVAVGAAALGGVIIACAAGAFDGDGSTTPQGASTATARVTEGRTTARATLTVTFEPATGLPGEATPTPASEPTSPSEPTAVPSPTLALEPTSNLEPTRPLATPAPTKDRDLPPAE
jgi:hypothetical protein